MKIDIETKVKLYNLVLPLFAHEAVVCYRCKGTGTTTARGDWCWPCKGGGIEIRRQRKF